jgi:hypothetical protein
MALKTKADLVAAVAPGTSWSYSKLHLFDECPWRWLKQYAHGMWGEDTPATALGRLVHVTLNELVQAVVTRQVEFGPEVLATAIARAYELEPKAAQLASEPKAYEEIRELAEGAILHYPFAEPSDQVCVEQELAMDLQPERVGTAPGSRPDQLTVTLDVLVVGPERVRITDWKTDRKPYPITQKKQLALYGAVVRRKYPGRRIDPELRFLRRRGHVEVPAAGEFEPLMDGAARWAVGTIRAIRETAARGDEAFKPVPGSYCRYCHLANICPAVADAAPAAAASAAPAGEASWETGELDEAKARALARDLLVLEARFKRGKELLRAWVSEHGPVTPEGGTGQWVLEPKYTTSWLNLGEVIARLPELGLEVNRVVTLDGKVMSQKLKTKRGQALLQGLYERVQTGTDFKFKTDDQTKAGEEGSAGAVGDGAVPAAGEPDPGAAA